MTETPSFHFQQILTVPHSLQTHLFRWQSEFELCDRTQALAKSLDDLCVLYCNLLTQTTQTSQLRTRFFQAPTEHMVPCLYYCDRSLDSAIHVIANVRRGINRLYEQLRKWLDVCINIRDAAQKMYKEVEADARPNLAQFVEERKAKAYVFQEFATRMQSVLKGGDTMFSHLKRKWCSDSPLCCRIMEEDERAVQQQPVPSHAGEQSQEGQQVPQSTPEQPPAEQQGEVGLAESQGDVPETPEQVREHVAEPPITQTSSPRKGRSLSQRKRSRECRDEEGGVKRRVLGSGVRGSVKSLQAVGRLGSDEVTSGSQGSLQGGGKRLRVAVGEGGNE